MDIPLDPAIMNGLGSGAVLVLLVVKMIMDKKKAEDTFTTEDREMLRDMYKWQSKFIEEGINKLIAVAEKQTEILSNLAHDIKDMKDG